MKQQPKTKEAVAKIGYHVILISSGGCAMRLKVQWLNMKGQRGDVAWETVVTDQDTQKTVGTVHHQPSPATRFISLFAGKHEDTFKSNEECEAFAKGVQAVLNHMVATGDQVASEQAA